MLIALVLLMILCICMARMIYVLIRDQENRFAEDHALRRELHNAGLLDRFEQLRTKIRLTSSTVIRPTEWSALKVGDQLIPKADVYLKPHQARRDDYHLHRQFTEGKSYPIVRVRPRTGVLFVMDDGGFRIPLNEFQGRNFTASAQANQGI
ncbi:MAG: hypothetical protein KAX55_04045 [Propionivibrio sp.]|nr:hypothetical protein [Propionivibrio sp.]